MSSGRTALPLALILAASLLAGCAGGDDDAGVSDDALGPAVLVPPDENLTIDPPEPAIPLELVLSGCSLQTGWFQAPLSFFASEIPAGFTPVSEAPGGQTVRVEIDAFTCETVAGDGVSGTAESQLWISLAVTPPAEYTGPGIGNYVVPLSITIPNDAVGAVLRAWGVGDVMETGSVTVTTLQDAGSVRMGQSSAREDGFFVEMATVATGSVVNADAAMGRVFLIEDGQVTGAIDVTVSTGQAIVGGLAAVRVEPGVVEQVSSLPIASPGLAYHAWGAEYGYTYRLVRFGVVETSG